MSEVVPPKTQSLPAWRTCLDVEEQEAGHYLEFVNRALIELVDGTPKRFLDLGCSSGAFGAALKAKFPGASVVGIEAGRAAAAQAQGRLDSVICSRLEDVDFTAPDLAGGFDAVIAADILEHLVNPWQLLLRLKAALAPGAQVLASIPNVRNLQIVSDLVLNGRWTYRELGLLDVTHLRFFTFTEIKQMLEETGYRLEASSENLSPALVQLYEKNRHQEKVSVRAGRVVLDDLTQREFYELCVEQFLLRCRAA